MFQSEEVGQMYGLLSLVLFKGTGSHKHFKYTKCSTFHHSSPACVTEHLFLQNERVAEWDDWIESHCPRSEDKGRSHESWATGGGITVPQSVFCWMVFFESTLLLPPILIAGSASHTISSLSLEGLKSEHSSNWSSVKVIHVSCLPEEEGACAYLQFSLHSHISLPLEKIILHFTLTTPHVCHTPVPHVSVIPSYLGPDPLGGFNVAQFKGMACCCWATRKLECQACSLWLDREPCTWLVCCSLFHRYAKDHSLMDLISVVLPCPLHWPNPYRWWQSVNQDWTVSKRDFQSSLSSHLSSYCFLSRKKEANLQHFVCFLLFYGIHTLVCHT